MKDMRGFFKICLSAFTAMVFLVSCEKNLPDSKLALGVNAKYTQTTFEPVLGRSTLYSQIFQYGNSSLPLNFKIVNMRTFAGDPAPELTQNYPVKVWKGIYDGTEKSIEEIESKRVIENHPLFEVRPQSGDLIMWAEANSNMISAQPDSGYVFDVEVSNSGGRRYMQNLRLLPLRERPYEPSNLNPITGQGTSVSVNATSINIMGERGQPMNTRDDIQILFRKTGEGNSITFKFIDSLSNPIDPSKFKDTEWEQVVHGFNMQKDEKQVRYDVAYPIPLVTRQTRYTTTSGQQAQSVFKFDRLAFGGVLQKCHVALNYNIYEEGDWELTFWFKRDMPKFDND